MNRKYLTFVLLAVLLWSFGGHAAFGQSAVKTLPSESGENITLFSDRSVYSITENIYFSAFYKAPETGQALDWSTVLYVELIKWDGSKLLQSKVSIEDHAAMGSIQIPANLESGNYYLRAYTKWMRNYSQYEYAYLPLKIINPFTRNIDEGPEMLQSGLTENNPGGMNTQEIIVVSGLENDYGRSDSAALEIEIADLNFEGRYCVSIARLVQETQAARSYTYVSSDTIEKPAEIEYLPEINGLSLSGRIVHRTSREPAVNIKVNLSSYSSSFYYSATNTGADGSFVFTLPHYNGQHEMHMAIEDDSVSEYEILLRSEFCNRPLTLPYIPFQLSDSERIAAEKMIFNAQVCYKFTPEDSIETESELATAFYGKPPTVILEEDFIELNDLEEFFYELVYNVSVAHKERKPYLIVHGETSLVSYPPLLLMDNIPVKNDEVLLSIPCRMIERIEVINSGYIVGDFKYNGIISIFSSNRDMAGLEQDENKHFFNYKLFDPEVTTCPRDMNMEQLSIPDRRNLLYWNPDLPLSSDQSASIEFKTPDSPGEYVLNIRGVDPESGEFVAKQAVFNVR